MKKSNTTGRGKRPGLRARSKNARVAVTGNRITLDERIELYRMREQVRLLMHFEPIDERTPYEGALLLVRLSNGSFRFGMCLQGRFAAYEHTAEEFVTMAHPERITHTMIVHDPVPRVPVVGELSIEEAAMAAGSAKDDRAEDVYA